MDPLLSELLERQLATGFADLAGTDLRLRLPVRESLVNELLARTVVASSSNIRHLEVAFGPANQLNVRVESSAIPLSPRLTLEFIVDRAVTLQPSPTIRLILQRQRVTRLLAIILPFVSGLLPPEVHWFSGALIVDIGSLLERNRDDLDVLIRLLPFVQSVELDSEPGRMWLNVHVHVTEATDRPHDTPQP
jgi:hypothetical protein